MLYYFQFVTEETEVQHGYLLPLLVVFIIGIYYKICLIAKLKIWIAKALVPIPPSTWSHSGNPRGSPLLLCPCEMGPQHLGSSEVRRDKNQYVLKGWCDSPDSIMWKGSAWCLPSKELRSRHSPHHTAYSTPMAFPFPHWAQSKTERVFSQEKMQRPKVNV